MTTKSSSEPLLEASSPRLRSSARGGVRLSEGSVQGQILNLTRYLLLGTIATMTFQLADAYFVAQLGTVELAALAFTFPVVLILNATALGLSMGVTSVVSRAVGNGDFEAARVLTTDSILLAFVVAVVFALIGAVSLEYIYGLMGAEAHVMVHIREYMHVWLIGMPVMIVPLIVNSVIRAFGDTKYPSLIMGGSAVVNIFLDPMLIFGVWIIPGLGLAGAAGALLISRFIAFFLSLFVLHFRVHGLVYAWPPLTRIFQSWRTLLHIALPSTATQLIQPVSAAVLTSLVASFGATAVAAYGVATRVEMFSLIFVMSLSIAMGPFVGQNAGARRFDRITEAIKFAHQACMIYGIVIAVILVLLGAAIAREFSEDQAVVALAAFYLTVVPLSYGCLGIINTSSGALNSLAKPFPAMIIGASKSLLVQIPCAYVGARYLGVKGVFVGTAVSSFVVSIIAFILVRNVMRGQVAAVTGSA